MQGNAHDEEHIDLHGECAAEIAKLRGLLDAAVGDEPMNQDEQGGCVWCGGSARGGMYADATPSHHAPDCPWLVARTYLDSTKPA